MAILVTGGAGYIGSHTCVELLGVGEEVIILDNFSNSDMQAVENIRAISGKEVPFYKADLLNLAEVQQVFADNDIEAVIHFAGYKAVGESVEKPLEYYHNNITGTLNLCRVMLEYGCKSIVFSSSATVYGTSQNLPFTEDSPTSATNPYGWTKVMLEQILTDIAHANPSWSVALLRYFNPVGAHASGLLGENPKGIPNNLVPFIAKVATGELENVQVFGDDFDTPDGTGVRDYIHVLDLALGHIKALEYNRKHTGVLTVNLGTGRGFSVLEVIEAFKKASGKEVPYKIVGRRAGDIASSYADPAFATQILDGWTAQYSLDDMCRDTWNYMVTSHQAK